MTNRDKPSIWPSRSDLVAYMEGVEIKEAGLLLQEWFQIDVTKPSETTTDRPQRREQPSEDIIYHLKT